MTLIIKKKFWDKLHPPKEEKPRFKSLYDYEKELAKERKERQKIFDLLGRTTDIPVVMRGKKANMPGVQIGELLIVAGYRRNGNKGFTRYLDRYERFHAYFDQGRFILAVHKDLISECRTKHRATEDGVNVEIERIKSLLKNE